MMLRFRLDTSLENLAKEGTFPDVVFQVVEAACLAEWHGKLIREALYSRPESDSLRQFVTSNPELAPPSGPSVTSNPELAPPSGPFAALLRVYLDQLGRISDLGLVGPYIRRNLTPIASAGFLNAGPKPPAPTDEAPREPQTPAGEPLEAVIDREHRVVLVGEGGLGKTCSLRHLARHFAIRAADRTTPSQGNDQRPVPVYAELGSYRGQPFDSWLAAQLEQAVVPGGETLGRTPEERVAVVQEWLRSPRGELIVLLDGFDLVPSDYRSTFLKELRVWCGNPFRAVISCRTKEEAETLSALGQPFRLAPLTEEGVREYLAGAIGLSAAEQLYRERLAADPQLRVLATNPFLLQIIAILAKNQPDGDIPANCGALLERLTQLIPALRRRDAVVDQMPLYVFLDELSALAFEMQFRQNLSPPLGELLSWNHVRPHPDYPFEAVLAQARNWRFIKSDGYMGEAVEFLHRMFVDYFAARAWNYARAKFSNSFDSFPGGFIFRDWWEKSVEMFAGICGDSRNFLAWFADEITSDEEGYLRVHNRRLGDAAGTLYRCWRSTLSDETAHLRDEIVDALMIAMHSLNPFSDADEALAEIGGPRVVSLLSSTLVETRETDVLYPMGALSVLKKIGTTDSIEPILSYYALCCDKPSIERKWALEAVLEILHREGLDLTGYQTFRRALTGEHPKVRSFACTVFAGVNNPIGIPDLTGLLVTLDEMAARDQGTTPQGTVAGDAAKAAQALRARVKAHDGTTSATNTS